MCCFFLHPHFVDGGFWKKLRSLKDNRNYSSRNCLNFNRYSNNAQDLPLHIL